MNNLIDNIINSLSKSLNEVDVKISMLNRKLNNITKHITYIYLLLLLDVFLNLVELLR